jgi:hypothetical protein
MDDASFYTVGHPEYFETLRQVPIQPVYSDLLRSVLPSQWEIVRSDIWLQVRSNTSTLPAEGFKIHLSSSLPLALTMIQRFVPVCASADVQFKIVADPMFHGFINSKRYPRGGSGKFATIYPPDHDNFLKLLAALHEVTKDLQGPYILSDKRYPVSKVIFYRWGGFHRIRELRFDGIHRMMVHAPNGSLVFDDRMPYFKLPDWVADPFPDTPEPEEDSDLLHNRYRVERVLAFTNTGGVYRAHDTQTDLKVVIKEARPHTLIWGPKKVALDATLVLKNEYVALERLQGLSCVPQPVEFYQEWEHTFLVQTYFDGIPLSSFRALDDFVVMSRMDDLEAVSRFTQTWREICLHLLDSVDAVHLRGVIIGDISPGNVLINPETREIVFIDLEGALLSDSGKEITLLGTQWFNPGFRRRESREAASLSRFDDSYSCGMLLYNLVCPIQSLFELDRNQPIFRILDHFVEAGLPPQIRAVIQAFLSGRPGEARNIAESWRLPDPENFGVSHGALAEVRMGS